MDSPHVLARNKVGRFRGIALDTPADAEGVPELLVEWPLWRVRALADGITRLLAMSKNEREELRRRCASQPEESRDDSDEVLRLAKADH